MRTRYLFVIGGVMSGVGKGISVASLGTILQAKGFNVSAIKIDPYINVDAGTMNPTEHGEVFVTEDGDETDQDIGSYERFLDKNILSTNYLTTGRVYKTVIERERNLEYNGRCVEVVPDIPNEVIRRIEYAAKVTGAEFMLVEIGGTVGEYQNLIFLEAARMMKLKDPTGVLSILVSYLPVPEKVGEMKTKPTQYAARTLNSAGIQPDMIIARSAVPLDNKRKEKISVFCNITSDDVISAPDVDNVYQVPLNFERDKISTRILNKFKVRPRTRDLKEWRALQDRIARAHKEVHIGIVGKYFGTGDFVLSDSYLSVIESIKHAAWANNAVPRIQWLDAEEYEKHPEKLHELKQFDGIIVPGGFGSRGVEGKIRAIEYVRKNKIPYFGLCYGMQLAVIEFARNVAKLSGAHTAEINPKAAHKIIDLMMEQKQNLETKKYGGTMRLGGYQCDLIPGTRAARAYKKRQIIERHRHRYEFNNQYREILEKKGLVISGINKERDLVEIVELPNHPFFVGTQFHPEFTSRPLRPHPLFNAFVKAGLKKR